MIRVWRILRSCVVARNAKENRPGEVERQRSIKTFVIRALGFKSHTVVYLLLQAARKTLFPSLYLKEFKLVLYFASPMDTKIKKKTQLILTNCPSQSVKITKHGTIRYVRMVSFYSVL